MGFFQGAVTWLLGWWISGSHPPAPRPPAPPVVTGPPDPPAKDAASRVVALVNQVRVQHGLRLLRPNPSLMAATQRHAALMAARGELSHQFPGEPSPADRDTAAGYAWSREGENAAAGQRTPAEAVAAWQADGPHLRNILGPYLDTGVGVATDARGVPYWVQDFGAPA